VSECSLFCEKTDLSAINCKIECRQIGIENFVFALYKLYIKRKTTNLQENRPRESNNFYESALGACSSRSNTAIGAAIPNFRVENLRVKSPIATIEVVCRSSGTIFIIVLICSFQCSFLAASFSVESVVKRKFFGPVMLHFLKLNREVHVALAKIALAGQSRRHALTAFENK
jgi:hypothetical protein